MNGKCRSDTTAHTGSLDSAMELLANQRRRHVLDYLVRESDGVADLEAVIEHVREHQSSVSENDHRAVRLALHHVHLPRLADAGVLTYHPSRGKVRYLGSSLLENLLEVVDHWERPAR